MTKLQKGCQGREYRCRFDGDGAFEARIKIQEPRFKILRGIPVGCPFFVVLIWKVELVEITFRRLSRQVLCYMLITDIHKLLI